MQIKNLLVCSSVLFGCISNNNSSADTMFSQQQHNVFFQNNNAMMQNNQFMNNNQFFNNNIAVQNNVQQFLINQNVNSKDGIITNWQNVNKFDWQLFQNNITNHASARTSAIRSLRSLFAGSGAQNFVNSDNEDERNLRLECARCVGGLMNFYSGNFNNTEKVFVKTSEFELFTMIANYYLISLSNGYNISEMQNNLQTLSWQQRYSLLPMLNNYGYQSYYQNYFLPRQFYTFNNTNSIPNYFLLNTITLQDWNKAVTMVKYIDLAGCLKKLVKGVNVTNYFENFRKCDNKTNNTQVNLNNGVGKCAFNSMFQLLSSNLQKLKLSNVVSPMTTGYFADFDKYLRNKQERTGMQLTLINELWNFEKTLSRVQLSDWNSDKNVTRAKNKLRKIQDKFSNESYITVLDLFSQIFPELRELYDENWEVNTIIRGDINSEQFYKIDYSKNYLLFSGAGNSSFGNINGGIQKNILFNDINSSQYMIDFDKQGRLFIYELTGMQLSVPGHNVAYNKYDNSSSNWRLVDSASQENTSTHGMQLGGIFQANKFKYWKEYAGVAAYMFKKVSPQEFVKSMPCGLVL